MGVRKGSDASDFVFLWFGRVSPVKPTKRHLFNEIVGVLVPKFLETAIRWLFGWQDSAIGVTRGVPTTPH